MLSIPQFLFFIVVSLICLNKFRQPIYIRPGFGTCRSVGETKSLVAVERLIHFVELLLWLCRSGFLNDTLTHENRIVVGRVFYGSLTILDVAYPFDRVPMQSFDISLSDTRAEYLKFPFRKLVFKLPSACTILFISQSITLSNIRFIERPIKFIAYTIFRSHL